MNILVDEFRRQFPSDQRSDEDITLLLAARDDGSFSQYPDFVADVKRITALRAATSELNTPSYAQEFSRALKRGAGSLKESAYGSAALAADVVGLEGARDAALEKYVESRDESAGENAATVGRVEDVDTIDKGVRFALAKGGELIPQVGEALVVGAAGALAGSAAGPGGTVAGGAAGLTEGFVARQSAKAIIKAGIDKILGKTAVDVATKQVVKDQLEKVAAKEVIEGALHPIAEKLLTAQIKSSAANMGSLGANIANFYGIGAGTIYGDLATREGVDREDARDAALIGGIGSALANAPLPAVILSRYFPGVGRDVAQSYIQRLAKDAALEIPLGATGETLDELVQIAAEKYADPRRRDTPLDDQDLSRLLNAAVVGGGAGAIGSVVSAIPGPSSVPNPESEVLDPRVQRYFKDVPPERQLQLLALLNRQKLGTATEGDLASLRSLPTQENNFVSAISGLEEEAKNKLVSELTQLKGGEQNGSKEKERQGRQDVLTEPAAAGTTTPAAAANRGQISNIDELIKNGGGKVRLVIDGVEIEFDKFGLVIDGYEATVPYVEIKDKSKTGKGIGKAAYVALGEALAARGITLKSTGALLDPGQKLWGSLVRDGYAEKSAGGYSFTAKESLPPNPGQSLLDAALAAAKAKQPISDQQVKDLVALKYTQTDIDNLSPEQAQTIIDAQLASQKALRRDKAKKLDPKEVTEEAKVKLEVDKAAAETKPNPTPEEVATGEYPKGKVDLGGITVAIETAKGELRQNKRGGEPWSVIMPATYGDIEGTVGADGDPVDVYVGDSPNSERVWIVDQIDPKTKDFDEHKTFVGFSTPEQVLAAYDASFSDGSGPTRRGRVTEMKRSEFDTWIKSGDTKKAVGYEKPTSESNPVATTSDSTHEEKLAHKRKIDEEHGKLVIQERDDIEFFGTDSDEAKVSSAKLRQFELDNAAWVGAARSALAAKGDTSLLPNVPSATTPATPVVAAASLSDAPSAADFLSATPEQVVDWKKRVKYGPETSKAIAATMTDAEYQQAVKERDSLREQETKLRNEATSFPKERMADSIKLLEQGGVISLKAQTLNEIIQDFDSKKNLAVTTESIGLVPQKGKKGKQGWLTSTDPNVDASVFIDPKKPDEIHLIGLKAKETGKGLGGAFVEKLKSLAKATGKKISLLAHADSKALQPKLESFYLKHGFVRDVDNGFIYDPSAPATAPVVQAKAAEVVAANAGTINGEARALRAEDVDIENKATYGSSKRGKKGAPSIVEPAWFRPTGLEARVPLITRLLSDRGTPSGSGKQKTARVTALLDNQTGKVHLVSTYESAPGKPAVTIFSEEFKPTGRGQKKDNKSVQLNVVLDAKLADGKPRFEVIGSMRTTYLTEFLHTEVPTQEQFEQDFGSKLDKETENIRSRAALIEQQRLELEQEKAARAGKKKGKVDDDALVGKDNAPVEENIQVKPKVVIKFNLDEPGVVDLDDDEVKTLVAGLATANITSTKDFADKVASGVIDDATMKVLQKTRAQDRDFIHRVIQDGIKQTLIDYDKASGGRTHYAGLFEPAQPSATEAAPGGVPNTEGRGGQGADRSAATVAGQQDSAGVTKQAGDAGNKVIDPTGGTVVAPTAPRGNVQAYLDSLIAVVDMPKSPTPEQTLSVRVSNLVRRELAGMANLGDGKSIVEQGTKIARRIGKEISNLFESKANALLASREKDLRGEGMTDADLAKFRSKIKDVGGIIEATTSGSYISSPGVESASVASARLQLQNISLAIDALGFGLSKEQKMGLYSDIYNAVIPQNNAASDQIADNLETVPAGWDKVEVDAEPEPVDPEQERILDFMYNMAADAGIDVRLIKSDRNRGLYNRENKLVTHWIGKAIGRSEVMTAMHELAHHVSLQMPMNIRRQVIGAIMRLTDAQLGIENHPDTRIRQNDPAKLGAATLQEERLVGATELSLLRSGFNPREASTIAQSFVRLMKDMYYKAVLNIQSLFGLRTNENLAREYFENSVKRLLSGDHSRYSYFDMLGLFKASPATRYDKWFKTSSVAGERLNSNGLTYDHQDNTTSEGMQFNIDAALHTMPVTENPRATRTTRVEREVAALNHLITLQDQAATLLEASDAADKALKGKTAMEWLRKMLKLPDPKAAKDELNGRLDFDGNPVEFNPDKVVGDFRDASNRDAVLDKMYRDTQSMAYKLDQAIRERVKNLERIKEYKEKVVERVANARKKYTDLDEQARLLRIESDKELRAMLDMVAGTRKRSRIAAQLRVLDPMNDPKEYGKAFERLVESRTLTGPRLVEALQIAVGIPTIDFNAKADEIHKAMKESGKFNALTQDNQNSRAMLAAVIAVAKQNKRMLAELELRGLKEGRAAIEAKLDQMLAGKAKFKTKRIVTRADSIETRILSEYAKDAKKVRDADEDAVDATNELKALRAIEPIVSQKMDELTGELGVALDFVFKDGAEFLAVKEGMKPDVIAKSKRKLTLDSSNNPTDPKALQEYVIDMKRFLMEREERYKAGDLAAKDRWYQRVERQYAEMATHLNYNLDAIPSGRTNFELSLMPEFSAIGDGFNTPAAQLFKRAGNLFAKTEAFLRNISDGIYDKDYRMRRELHRLLPGLNDDNLQTFIDAAKFDIEDNMADLVELYADKPDKLKRLIYNRVRDNIMNTKLAKDIGLSKVADRFMHTFEKLLDHEWQAGEEHYKGRVVKGIEVANPITGKDEATGLKVKDSGIRVMDDDGKLVAGQRRHIAKGWRTFGGRRMSNGFNQMIGAMRRSDWASFGNYVGDGKLKEAYKEDPEVARELLNKFFNHPKDGQVVRDWFLQMLASRQQESSFDAPALEDEVTIPPADPQKVLRAFNEAPDGDVLQFIENMYELHDGVSDRATYVQHIADQLQEHWNDVDNIAKKYFPDDGSQNPMNTIQGMSPNALIDAREISGLPSEWFSFYKFDKPSLHKLSRLIAAEVAFGRSSETLAGLMDTVANEVKDAITKLEAERARVRTENRTWDKDRVEKVVAKMPDYKRLKTFEDRAALIPNSIKGISQFFRKDNTMEANLAAGIRLTQLTSRLMVNNPSSAIYQIAALFDPMFRFGLTPAAIRSTATALKTHVNESVASLAQALGFQILNSEHNQRFNELNLQYPERIKKFGDEFRRWDNESAVSHAARLAEETISFPVGRGENKQHVQFRPTALFDWTTMIADRSLDAGMQNLVGNFMARGIEFYRNNPDKAEDFNYQLSDKDLNLRFGDGATLKQLRVDMQNFGLNFDQMVKNAIKRGDGRVFTDQEALTLNAMAMFLVSSQSNISTMKSSFWNNSVLRAAVPLLGWMGRRTLDVAGKRLDSNGKLQAQALIRGLTGIAAVSVGGLALSAIVDKYYEELIGKKRNLRPMTSPLGLTEHIARVGSFGFFGELANGAISVGQGGDSRIISADRRIVGLSAIMTAQQAASALINQGEFDYSRVGRPLFTAIGGGGLLQYMGMYNKLTGADNVESRINARINAQNYLRVIGRELELPVRGFSGGVGTPTPMTPYITRMELAAYANNAVDFRNAYTEAIKQAKAQGFEDPVDHVKRSFASKNPLRSVFQTAPSEKEYERILLALPQDGRDAVSEAVNQFNRYAESIGARGFEGKADKKSSAIQAKYPSPFSQTRAPAFSVKG